jgi:hypothetical protein
MGMETGARRATVVRHRQIVEEFDRLKQIDVQADPVKAAYIAKDYYIGIVSEISGMSKSRVARIINERYRNRL